MCSDLSKEFQRFDEKPEKYFKSFEGIRVSTYVSASVCLGMYDLCVKNGVQVFQLYPLRTVVVCYCKSTEPFLIRLSCFAIEREKTASPRYDDLRLSSKHTQTHVTYAHKHAEKHRHNT